MTAFNRARATLIAQAGEKKRQVTITNLIARFEAKNGRKPSETEIAALLATSVRRVRHHLSKIKG